MIDFFLHIILIAFSNLHKMADFRHFFGQFYPLFCPNRRDFYHSPPGRGEGRSTSPLPNLLEATPRGPALPHGGP